MKTMNQIRDLLCEEIDALRAKKTTAANVNAVVNATGKILTTIKMEMEYAKSVGKSANMKFIELEDVKVEAAPKAKPTADKSAP